MQETKLFFGCQNIKLRNYLLAKLNKNTLLFPCLFDLIKLNKFCCHNRAAGVLIWFCYKTTKLTTANSTQAQTLDWWLWVTTTGIHVLVPNFSFKYLTLWLTSYWIIGLQENWKQNCRSFPRKFQFNLNSNASYKGNRNLKLLKLILIQKFLIFNFISTYIFFARALLCSIRQTWQIVSPFFLFLCISKVEDIEF